jgi:hypothetical protein
MQGEYVKKPLAAGNRVGLTAAARAKLIEKKYNIYPLGSLLVLPCI